MFKKILSLAIVSGFYASAHAAHSYHLVTPLESVSQNTRGTYSISDARLEFSTTPLGSSAVGRIVVTNTGKITQNNVRATVTRNSSQFSVSSACANSIAPGEYCELLITYAPQKGESTGTLQVSLEPGGFRSIELVGNPLIDNLHLDASVDFGTVVTGELVTQTLTLSNTGGLSAPLTYSALPQGISLGGTCAEQLAPRSACDLVVTWMPTEKQTIAQPIIITAPNSEVSLMIQGQSIVAANLQANALSQPFGTLEVGHSVVKTWTITNHGEVTTPLNQGSLPSGITKQTDCPESLAGGQSCSVSLTWSPTAAGTLSHSFTVGSLTIPLSGAAQNPPPPVTIVRGFQSPMDYGDYGNGWYESTDYVVELSIPAGLSISSVAILNPENTISGGYNYIFAGISNAARNIIYFTAGLIQPYTLYNTVIRVTLSNGHSVDLNVGTVYVYFRYGNYW